MTSHTSTSIRAMFWMGGAILSFSTMAIGGRSVSHDLDTFEIMLYRSIVGIVIVTTLLTLRGRWGQVSFRHLGLHALRNVAHFTGQNLWFFSLTLIPLAQVFALEFSTPLWVTLLAPLVLGERLTRLRLATVVMGFVGILIVARPGFGVFSPGLVTAALAAIGFAGSILFTKMLTRRGPVIGILFWLVVMQAVFGLVCAGIDGDIARPGPASTAWVILIGAAGLFAHFCLTTALSLAPATIVSPIDFLRLPLIAIVGALIYAEPLDPFVLLGSAVIFGANYINIRADARQTGAVRQQ